MDKIAALAALAGGAFISRDYMMSSSGGRGDIVKDLTPHLSSGASIHLSTSPEFESLTARWQSYHPPDFSVVVEPTSEEDVRQTVLYANEHDIQFLAVTGTHGGIETLWSVHDGIQIRMRSMNHVEVAPDGKTATVGGGVIMKELTDALWASGKYAVTGICECTSYAGAMLGGGHGILQGRYGLSIDNLLEARVVLANGTGVTVSPTSHPDLFWAVRGAGHNFGIVTEAKIKLYDVPDTDWKYEIFIFGHDSVEAIYEQLNNVTNHCRDQPSGMVHWTYFMRQPSIDPNNAIIWLIVLYEGPSEELRKYAAPFHTLQPLIAQDGAIAFPDIASLTYMDLNGPACTHGLSNQRFPVGLKDYNPQAQRDVYNAFNEMGAKRPALNGSFFMFEGYSLQGVKAVPPGSTAFPHRDDNLLNAIDVIYQPDPSLDEEAIRYGQQMVQILQEGSGSDRLNAYVNYAHGEETLEEMYGFEPWRLEKLRRLKKRYDPKGKFNFYAPIY